MSEIYEKKHTPQMTWREISELPTSVSRIPNGSSGVHESCLRSYHVLMRVRNWLGQGVPNNIIADMVDETMAARGGSGYGELPLPLCLCGKPAKQHDSVCTQCEQRRSEANPGLGPS